MNKRILIAAAALAAGAPAAAQGYDPGKPLQAQIAEKCGAKKGQQRTDCEQRIRESYDRHLARKAASAKPPRG